MIIIKKYPFVRQDEIKDCGVTCLEMVIKYYGGFIKKSTLLELTKTNKEGTTLYHLNDTLLKLGFNSHGVKCNLDDIASDNIILPCIASVTINEYYKHFIVIYEINFKKKYLIIADPANKIRKMGNFCDIHNCGSPTEHFPVNLSFQLCEPYVIGYVFYVAYDWGKRSIDYTLDTSIKTRADMKHIRGIKTDRDMYTKVEEIINEIRDNCGVEV